jgi:hypothetical protein
MSLDHARRAVLRDWIMFVYDFIPVPGNNMVMVKQKNMYVMHLRDALPAINVL